MVTVYFKFVTYSFVVKQFTSNSLDLHQVFFLHFMVIYIFFKIKNETAKKIAVQGGKRIPIRNLC